MTKSEVSSKLVWVVTFEDLDILLHPISNVDCDCQQLLLLLSVALSLSRLLQGLFLLAIIFVNFFLLL